ncbi:MAG TPA: DUF222 domain-containing protein [Ornithinibacter sp.]|nr:DUF222 domain-containing protein [Ornithinibacter sp.]
MVTGGLGLAKRRSHIRAARDALRGLGEALHEASGPELRELMTLADEVSAAGGAARAVITVEAISRGEVTESGMSAHAWVREHAPSLRQGGAGHVARIAVEASGGARPPLSGDAVRLDPDSAAGIVWERVKDGCVSPALAVSVLSEASRLAPLLRDEVMPTVTRQLVELGTTWGPTVMRRLRPRLLAEYGRVGVLEDIQERLASAARLSSPLVESGDLTEYQLVMTPEQAVVLEAAIGPLSAPAPNDETRERDLRPAAQRRVEALAEVCRRSSAVDAADEGLDGPAAAPAAVHVTIALTDLEQRIGCGEVLGSTATGTILSAETLRRVACDAALVPHVLGTAGEDLDLGRVVRLFTRAQRRRLWRRDRGCTYPGCTAPASWCRAHHVVHWADGGPSDVDNAALVCQRHHTTVHRRRLTAEVRRAPDERGRYVVWDLSEGSYDRHLERLRTERSANDPAPLTPEGLREVLAALTLGDEDERRVADHELHLHDGDPWPDAEHDVA